MDIAVETFISAYSQEVQDLFLQARRLVFELAPESVEQIDAPSRLAAYGLGTRMNETIFTLMPLKAGLNIGVYRAVELPDPAGLLSGTGKLHRHVRINQPADFDSPALRALLTTAVSAARSRKGISAK